QLGVAAVPDGAGGEEQVVVAAVTAGGGDGRLAPRHLRGEVGGSQQNHVGPTDRRLPNPLRIPILVGGRRNHADSCQRTRPFARRRKWVRLTHIGNVVCS